MPTLHKLILLLTLALLTLSCKKNFLEPEIKTEIDLRNFGKTPTEADLLLGQSYSELRDNNIVGSMFYTRFTTDYNVPAPGTTFAQSAIARMNYDVSDGEVYNIWTAHYKAASRPNLVIERAETFGTVAGLSATDSASWKRINGEARFLRGFLYFNLVRLYRNAPIIDKFFTSFEEIDAVSNLPADQMKVQESKLYDFIVADLVKAAEMLPASPQRGRAGKFSALAMLAKVYLTRATIAKHRDATGTGTADYQAVVGTCTQIMASNQFRLKQYYPDNFIRDKQYAGNNEFLFSLEYADLDGAGARVGENAGFVKNSSGNAELGTVNGANGSFLANDFGWSVFDFNSPGDLVRRFWTFEEAIFYDFETNGISGLQNSSSDCPNGVNCEAYLRTREPYPYTRPYWFETIVNANSFRNRPITVDVGTVSATNRYFTNIWGDANANSTPQLQFVKYRRNPVTQPNYTSSTYDADLPILRYAEVLLMYAEAGNELGGPTLVPAGGIITPVAAVNLVRDRARNFVLYPTLTVDSRIMENSTYVRTYSDIYRRIPTVNTTTPALYPPQQAADTFAKYFIQISAFRGIREVPPTPIIRNFKEFPASAGYVPDFSPALSQTQFRDELLDERWRELAGEQNCRWYDLTRYGRLINRIVAIKTQVNPLTNRNLTATNYGTGVLINPNPKFEYLPIPQSEIDRNKNLKQNQGY